ncbi:hypothetical protein GBA52_026810 [Prunus armeniaca]|nr:hypothetical protein GBA52_026810 [Prunus armeniaca]
MEESNTRSKLKRICVYWESNFGHRKVFGDTALEFAHKLLLTERKVPTRLMEEKYYKAGGFVAETYSLEQAKTRLVKLMK